MRTTRIHFLVHVDLGSFGREHKVREILRAVLTNRIGDYNPQITPAPEINKEYNHPNCATYLVGVDMDGRPGPMCNKAIAYRVVRSILQIEARQYSPLVRSVPVGVKLEVKS